MVHAMEFHGRLRRADGRPADPGVVDLVFGLFASPDGGAPLWEEEVRDVRIGPEGEYHTVLGDLNALRPALFDGSTRYLAVRVVRGGRREAELSDRVPVLGLVVALGDEVRRIDGRVAAVEAGGEAQVRTAKRVRVLRRRIRRLEAGEGPIAPLLERIAALEARLARLDGAEGRVARLEDELEDIVGPDGDLVDLTERIEALEKSGRSGRGAG